MVNFPGDRFILGLTDLPMLECPATECWRLAARSHHRGINNFPASMDLLESRFLMGSDILNEVRDGIVLLFWK